MGTDPTSATTPSDAQEIKALKDIEQLQSEVTQLKQKTSTLGRLASQNSGTKTTPNAAQEAEMLQLEIKQLKQQTNTLGQVRPFVPAAAAVATLIVGMSGLLRYLSDRRRDRKLRIEADIAEYLQRLNEAPESAGSASGRAVAALIYLKSLTSHKDADADRRAQVTSALVAIVERDLLEFDTPARAYFPVICLDRWGPYNERMSNDAPACRALIARYRASLGRIRDDNPGWVGTVRRHPEGGYSADNIPVTEADRLLFPTLVDGYAAHVDRLPQEARGQELGNFAEVTNPQLRDDVFPP